VRILPWSALALAACTACYSQRREAADTQPPASDATLEDSAAPEPSWSPLAAMCSSYKLHCNMRARLSAQQQLDEPALAVPGSTQPQLSAGPILGAISDSGVKVWLRSDREAAFRVRVWPEDGGETLPDVEGPQLIAANDFSAAVQIAGLAPAQHYGYALLLRAAGTSLDSAVQVATGEFHTLAGDHEPAHTRLVVGADISGSGPQPIFEQIRKADPDFVLLIGDQVYTDGIEPTRDAYTSLYLNNWNIQHLRGLLQQVPAFMIWDDHEIQDNYWMGKSGRYEPARAAYDLYVQAHNPAAFRTGGLYYTFRSGDVAFFVLDVRSQRSPNTDADDARKSMLGAAQKRDLISWLRCEPATLKVIVSPVLWNDWAQTGADAWMSFKTEREELLGYIAQEAVGDVLLLSGDQHWSAVFRYERAGYRFYEFLPTPLSKTRGVAPSVETDEILARDDDNFVFGVVDVDTTAQPYTVDLTLCALDKPCRPGAEPEPRTALDPDGARENVPFTLHLSARDIGMPK
jgi:alkaline phosphatase D